MDYHLKPEFEHESAVIHKESCHSYPAPAVDNERLNEFNFFQYQKTD